MPDFQRPTAQDIHDRAHADGQDALGRSAGALAASALGAGLLMGLSGLGTAIVTAIMGDATGTKLLAAALYPIGFLAVIIGRAQLFTENTLYPVIVCLEERRLARVAATARVWAVVLAANLVGALLFALLAVETHALASGAREHLVATGAEVADGPWWGLFWSGVVGGWLVALTAWLVLAAEDAIGRVVVIFLFTFLVGLGAFAHSIAGSSETLASVLGGALDVGGFLRWLAAAVLGNTVGGVLVVALLNHGQVRPDRARDERGGAPGPIRAAAERIRDGGDGGDGAEAPARRRAPRAG